MSHDESISLRTPRIYALVMAVTCIVVAVSAFGWVTWGSTAFIVLMIAVVATGIPHGAVDHVVAARLYGLSDRLSDQAKFYGGYLAAMAVYGALWTVLPAWCLAAFLVMTMYHFGQADLAYWELPPVRARLLYLSRGLLLMGLPIVAFPDVVDPIFNAIAGVQPGTWAWIAESQIAVLVGLVTQHVVLLGGTALSADVDVPEQGGREAVNTAVLAALFIWVHPLVAFAVYFGLWHSLGHILELLQFFRSRQPAPASASDRSVEADPDDPVTLPGFYQKAALYTGISFIGLGGLYAATQSFGLQDQMIALLFILISVMTLPHMVIVERLYQDRDVRATTHSV